MYLKSWSPAFNKKSILGYPCVYFVATLECPACKKIIQAETIGYEVRGSHLTRMDLQINDLKKPRPCLKCGVVSTLPEKDEKNLREQAVAITEAEFKKYLKDKNKPAVICALK